VFPDGTRAVGPKKKRNRTRKVLHVPADKARWTDVLRRKGPAGPAGRRGVEIATGGRVGPGSCHARGRRDPGNPLKGKLLSLPVALWAPVLPSSFGQVPGRPRLNGQAGAGGRSRPRRSAEHVQLAADACRRAPSCARARSVGAAWARYYCRPPSAFFVLVRWPSPWNQPVSRAARHQRAVSRANESAPVPDELFRLGAWFLEHAPRAPAQARSPPASSNISPHAGTTWKRQVSQRELRASGGTFSSLGWRRPLGHPSTILFFARASATRSPSRPPPLPPPPVWPALPPARNFFWPAR